MKKLFLIAALLLMTGCMATGTQVKEEQLAQFKKGKSTIEDVKTALGEPNSSSVDTDGKRQMCYVYMQAVARPESFIPIAGAFVGGADSKINSVCFSFNSVGVLKNYTSTTSQSGAGYGLESGTTTTPNRVPSEPKQSE